MAERGCKKYIELDKSIEEYYRNSKLINVFNTDGKLIGLKSIGKEEYRGKCITILKSLRFFHFGILLLDKEREYTL